MFRLISYLILIIFLITILRSVIGFLMRLFATAVRRPDVDRQTPENVPPTSELKKDPVCGTYTPAATSLRETVGGQTFYFCSAACRDKFALQSSQRR